MVRVKRLVRQNDKRGLGNPEVTSSADWRYSHFPEMPTER
jgi:hypothetical protein